MDPDQETPEIVVSGSGLNRISDNIVDNAIALLPSPADLVSITGCISVTDPDPVPEKFQIRF